ncbi:MAG: enoyl-CoA hydratase/isomerase family protein [Deltaproteobacteria bacterium]|nr:enoyl-CoA hydratase/isomerase family protein [Deltaproteobacteria bacterium]
MKYETINYMVKDRVAWVTINQAKKMNRLSNVVLQEITEVVKSADQDNDVKVLVISGSGEKAFCAGADLKSLMHDSILRSRENLNYYAEMCLSFIRLGKPSISMIRGFALAGGCGLAILPTFSIASEDAKLGLPEINVGMWPMMVMATLFRTVGKKKGLELICTGEIISAREAERIGMITRAVPHDELENYVRELADELKGKSGSILRLGLEAYQNSVDMEYLKAIGYLKDMAAIVSNTPDSQEGTAAFRERRRPNWSS